MDLVDRLGPGEFAAVADQFRQLDHLGESGGEYDLILRGWAKADPLTALEYVEKFPNGRAGSATILSTWAGKDSAAEWIASMAQGDIKNRASHNVAEALAKEDIAKAAAWVRTLKPEAQVEAARGVIPIMSSADISGTAQWVSSLAGTPNDDRAVEEFVWSCNSRAPEQSAAWIMGVSDPDQQRRLYYRMLGEWAQHDVNAMKKWVASNPNNVPPDVLKRFSH